MQALGTDPVELYEAKPDQKSLLTRRRRPVLLGADFHALARSDRVRPIVRDGPPKPKISFESRQIDTVSYAKPTQGTFLPQISWPNRSRDGH